MKKLVIFMAMLCLMFSGVVYGEQQVEEVLPTKEMTAAQKVETARVKNFVIELREKLPTETLIITKDNFHSTADVIEYLLQAEGWKEKDYSIDGGVVDDENGTYAIYNIYIRLYTFPATFITTATFEYQDIEPEGEPI